jgi:hypothetical protein
MTSAVPVEVSSTMTTLAAALLSAAIGRAFAVFVPLVSDFLDAFAATTPGSRGGAMSARRAS